MNDLHLSTFHKCRETICIPCVVLETTEHLFQLLRYQQLQHSDGGIIMLTQAEFVFASAQVM